MNQAQILIADLVNAIFDEVHRLSPPTLYVSREWLEKAEATIPAAIGNVLQSVKGLPPPASEALRKIVEDIVTESWKKTSAEHRPKAWVEKWYAAETDEDRKRIYYSALKYKCLDMKRKRAEEEKLFVSYDELADRASAGEGERKSQRPALPSTQDNQDAGLLKEKLHEALLELPIMIAVTARLLPLADGNVSKLARHLSLPQRQVARYVARIRKHFAEKGLGPV